VAISLLKILDGPWEQARNYLRKDLDSITIAFNQLLAKTFGTTGVLPPSAGGSGASSFTAHGVLVGEGSNPVVAVPPGTTGQFLAGVTGADPKMRAILVSDLPASASGVELEPVWIDGGIPNGNGTTSSFFGYNVLDAGAP
jgi:hypothetical protein